MNELDELLSIVAEQILQRHDTKAREFVSRMCLLGGVDAAVLALASLEASCREDAIVFCLEFAPWDCHRCMLERFREQRFANGYIYFCDAALYAEHSEWGKASAQLLQAVRCDDIFLPRMPLPSGTSSSVPKYSFSSRNGLVGIPGEAQVLECLSFRDEYALSPLSRRCEIMNRLVDFNGSGASRLVHAVGLKLIISDRVWIKAIGHGVTLCGQHKQTVLESPAEKGLLDVEEKLYLDLKNDEALASHEKDYGAKGVKERISPRETDLSICRERTQKLREYVRSNGIIEKLMNKQPVED